MLYSSGVFDLDAGPLTVTLPAAGKRFMSMLVLNQDQYTIKVAYAPGRHVFDRKSVGTRYLIVIIRTLVNEDDPQDIAAANRLQDAITTQPDLADSPSFSGFGAILPFVTICFVNPAAQRIGEKWL